MFFLKRTASVAILFGFAVVLTGADDKKPQNVKSDDPRPIDVRTDIRAPGEIAGKNRVMDELRRIYSQNTPPVSISGRKFMEQTPDFTIIPGKNGKSTLIYRFRYISPDQVTDAIETVLSDGGSIEMLRTPGSTDDTNSKILIHDETSKMEELKAILLALDKMHPQVLVEAQILEIYYEQGAERDASLSYSHFDAKSGTTSSVGFDLDSPTQNYNPFQGGMMNATPLSSVSGNGNTDSINLAFRWLNSSRDARILSSPNIIADQGASASIITGEDLPIPETTALAQSTNLSFKYKRVGVTLNITPKIISGTTVQLEVNPEVKSVLRYQAFTQNETTSNIPVISVRSITTRLTVSDGDVIVLGGLYSNETSESIKKIPFFGDIPLLGDLINGRDTRTTDKQLVFLMKIHVLQPGEIKTVDVEESALQTQRSAQAIGHNDAIFPIRPAAPLFDIEQATLRTAREQEKDRMDAQREFYGKNPDSVPLWFKKAKEREAGILAPPVEEIPSPAPVLPVAPTPEAVKP